MEMAGQAYQITIKNESAIDTENAIVFQSAPQKPADVHSLAWLSKACHSNTWLEFDWTIDYNFVWGQAGVLKPGVNYKAGQVVDADLVSANQVSLLYEGGGFKFSPVTRNTTRGALFIDQGLDIPGDGDPNQGSVGIGMSGAGTFVKPTNPSSNGSGPGGRQFTITPEYWVAFGAHEAGAVVTEDMLRFPQRIQFPDGKFTAECVFTGVGWQATTFA
jgi:hypothetical protein